MVSSDHGRAVQSASQPKYQVSFPPSVCRGDCLFAAPKLKVLASDIFIAAFTVKLKAIVNIRLGGYYLIGYRRLIRYSLFFSTAGHAGGYDSPNCADIRAIHRIFNNTEKDETIRFIPLAIVQAAAYISDPNRGRSVRQYLDEFQKSDRKKFCLLDHEEGQFRRDWEAKNSVLITWQISFYSIRQSRRSAANLLSLMSFFDRQGIPETRLRDRGRQTNGELNDDDDADDSESQSSTQISSKMTSSHCKGTP
ncbi:hypothetical protein TSTA_109450 [Talaromyces stipitatus ATCC 10500]|uniref:Uncharacterized protein n=1 Tax=Talaromyces stipitatus (strain ATCC 10500 / CBS 375.48 / QM 6759 / NRRL 1006) TaxID=441959 RepID=B8MV50_TALSN|nr:uncharacterized protein TSTA_109450 [Talaromyces stipitatus ATCC 10500]EED11766.1 hypothetical protein TSTA_109450 [Talaromyces stipitatus ATCC 10500]